MITQSSSNGRVISVFVLAMLNVAIMASLRNLPLIATYGVSALFFFGLVGLAFLVPSALVSAELATGWPKSGGIYIWVREAFGDRWGFFAIWMQWVHNVTWYPAILSFVASTFAYVFNPALAQNNTFVISVVLVSFWGMTILNYFGIKTTSLVSTFGVLLGTILPGIFIVSLGILWIGRSEPMHISFSSPIIPDLSNISNLVFLAGFFLTFAGLEVSSAYAARVQNPQRNYPRAILLAAGITFCLLLLGSLAIAIVIPKEDISLVSGLMEAYKVFFEKYSLTALLPVLAILLAVGSLAEVNSWIIGPVMALHTTSIHGNLPPVFQKLNKHGMPVNLLFFQAIIVTIAACVFIFVPNLSSAYWILTASSAQIYLVMYILMFLAAIRLRYTRPHVPRAYRIPHPHKGIWIVALIGTLASICGIILTFILPAQLEFKSVVFFESFLIIGLLSMMAIPLLIYQSKKSSWEPSADASLVDQ